jgi:hypothetical protein
MEPFFSIAFWSTLIMLWIALIILYFILTNRKSLERKGYNEKYIAFLRKSHLIRVIIIAIVLPLLILFSAWVVWKITGALTEEAQLAYIVLILFVLVVPFKFLDERFTQKRIRDLALETKEKVAIDLNYKTLHLIFNPTWEIILGLSVLAYGILFLKIEQWIIYLFILFPWFMYLNLRGTRYQTRPYLKDNYRYTFVFNLFCFLFFLFYFCSYFIIRATETLEIQSGASGLYADNMKQVLLLFLGLILLLGWIGRIAVYLSNYRVFNREISGNQDRVVNSPFRKLAFFALAVLILLTFFGIGLMTGLFKQDNTEVGTVLKKYLVEEKGKTLDTIAIETDGKMEFLKKGVDLNDLNKEGRLRMYCTIELCNSKRIKEYEICCKTTYEDLPMGLLVKYEYRSDNTLTRLLE